VLREIFLRKYLGKIFVSAGDMFLFYCNSQFVKIAEVSKFVSLIYFYLKKTTTL